MSSSSQPDAPTPVNERPSFKDAYCQLRGIDPSAFEQHLFCDVVFLRARIYGLFVQPFYPNLFHNERALIREVGDNTTLGEMKTDIDFYQHKYVVNSLWRDLFKVRVSGQRLLRIARDAFNR
jgi:hypothetical protein